MMKIEKGNRDEWEFEYTARSLAEGAAIQKRFRQGRVKWWTEAKAQVMTEVKESGIEVSESVAAGQHSNYTNAGGPQILVRADLQKKLAECHGKIQTHQQAVDEYDGWEKVLLANPEARLKLTHADWLYFFFTT